MSIHRFIPRLFGISAAAAMSLFLGAAAAQTLGQPEHFTASAVDLNSGQTGTIEISVTRWSTAAERPSFNRRFSRKGRTACSTTCVTYVPSDEFIRPDRSVTTFDTQSSARSRMADAK